MAFMVFDLEYAAARVRAMRARLLSPAELDDIRSARTREGLLAHLANTPYERLFSPRDIDEIEAGFDNHLVETLNRVLSFLPKKLERDFQLFMKRWDLQNLKTLVRGLYAGTPLENMRTDMVRHGPVWDAVMERDVSSLEELASALGESHWTQALREGAAAFKESGLVADLEAPLDREYARQLDMIEAPPVRAFAEEQKRLADFAVMMRARAAGISADKHLFFPEQSEETMRKYSRLAEGDVEANARDELVRAARSALLFDPFGVGLYIDYMLRKEMEARELKAKARLAWKL